ncbi:MAG: hypothetical protein BRD50_01590 [Bacteroidetes bacterium SW_11_45_7]|nr:MAG: hypothetical protein BRD50_01590 [Bacteroidetes bacterium SW_11_45_7]
MQFGLKDQHVDKLRKVFAHYPNVSEVIIYGSRAKGTHKHTSDIDLVVKGEDLTLRYLNCIDRELDDLLLPWKIDLSLYRQIDNQDLLAHIERVGLVFYKRSEKTVSEK